MSLDDMRAFLNASEAVHFAGQKKEEVYAWVGACLGEQNWVELGRTARGLVRRYMEKMTGLSRAQITRLITQYGQSGEVRAKRSQRRRFATVYTPEDIVLLAGMDEAHETLSGPATQKSYSASFMTSTTSASTDWRGSRWPKYTVCARPLGAGNCGWTRYTKEIGTG